MPVLRKSRFLEILQKHENVTPDLDLDKNKLWKVITMMSITIKEGCIKSSVKGEAISFFVFIMVPSARCQGLNGGNYIERQLLCALDKAPCDIFGEQIKQALPEIIGRNCATCDQRRLASVQRVARFVQANYPAAWAAIVQKYSKNN